jgi:hypothetical protein
VKKFDQCNKGIVSAIAQNTENEIKNICTCNVENSSPSGYDTCCWLCLERSLFLPLLKNKVQPATAAPQETFADPAQRHQAAICRKKCNRQEILSLTII